MSGGIFLITEDNILVEMQSSPYPSEDALQSMIAQFPRLLSSCSENQEASKWLLISREIGVPDNENRSSRWSLDHLFIDGEGIPVLVEVKRSTDTRIRREVVGQMLDYAANAVAYWPIEHIQSSYFAECEKLGLIPQDNLEKFLAGRDEELFWKSVKTNLQAGRIRMLFVADHIPNDLKRIIEFMNVQMEPAEVFGIEVKQYTNGNFRTIAPVIVGQTSGAEARKQAVSLAQRQAKENLQETMDVFNQLASGRYTATGRASLYRQVKLPEFPESMHYEFFHSYSDGVTAEFHIEAAKYNSVSSVLQELAREVPEINGGRVDFDPTWQNRGRLRVVQKVRSPKITAETMLVLIERTKSRIGEAIAKCG